MTKDSNAPSFGARTRPVERGGRTHLKRWCKQRCRTYRRFSVRRDMRNPWVAQPRIIAPITDLDRKRFGILVSSDKLSWWPWKPIPASSRVVTAPVGIRRGQGM